MSRRHFFRKLYAALKSMAIAGILSNRVLAATSSMMDTSDKRHFKPLNGRSLRDIALQKSHHGSSGFLNPLGPARQGRLWQVMRWKLFHENRFKEDFAGERVIPVSINWDSVKQHRGTSITFIKHASVLLKDEDYTIIVDPVFSSIFWFIKDFAPLKSDMGSMPTPDHVLITHGHYDHLDEPSLNFFGKDMHVITPLGYNGIFKDLEMKNRTQLDWFDTYYNGKQKITLLPCNHWTMRNPFTGPNRSLWGSYLVTTANGRNIFLSGDTAYFDGFEQLGKEYDIDLAVFNLGAYEPRWFMAPSHMNPRETVQAFKELNAKRLMVIHWGTFRLGDEPVHFPPMHIKQELKKEGMLDRLVDLKPGQSYFFDSSS